MANYKSIYTGAQIDSAIGKANTALQEEQYTGTYSKPSGGIPKTDLASSVQTSLNKADSAYQKANTGIPEEDLSEDVQDKLNSGGGGGTTVQANPTLDGTESHLDGLKVGNTKYSTSPDLSGKVISIMGDSISTYNGWIPDGSDGRNLSHVYWYPQKYVNDVTKTWWHQLIFKEFKAKLGVNESWSGSCVGNNKDVNEEKSGPDTCMASIKRITNLGSNGTPDIIYVYGGTNDIGNPGRSGQSLGTFNSSTNYTTVDLTTSKWTCFVDSFRVMIQRMQYYYPKAKIIVMLPAFSVTYYNRATQDSYLEQMKEICDYFGVEYIDLRDCGITWANSDASRNNKGVASIGDGFTHPNEYGMDLITEYVKNKTFAMLENDSNENIVHTVTNTLSTLTNTDRYIKGVSDGESYSATLTGADLTVGRVSMGGTDITSTAYDSSTGIITISNVTGDIVVSEGEAVITPVTGVSLNAQTKSIMPNDVETLTATIIPANATNKNVTWSVNNNNVTIVPNGLTCQVTGVTDGTSVVTVTTQDGSFTASCTFTIHEIELENIAITTPPSTTAYHYGDTFSKTGMVVTAYYDDETSEELDDTDYTVSPSGALTDSDTSVTVNYTYNGVTKTATQAITVSTLSSIAVTTQPTKTIYEVGDVFDPTGMIVTATWSDNTTSEVTNYTYSPTTALSSSDTTITISYTIGGVTKTATQAIVFTNTTWYSSNYNANTLTEASIPSSAGFSYKSGVHDADGLKMNKVRFVLSTAGTITVGKVSGDFKTVTDSETVSVTGNAKEVKEITLTKTYTLSNGEHFFISSSSDTGKFLFTRNATAGDKDFMTRVGASSANLYRGAGLSVDFGYNGA